MVERQVSADNVTLGDRVCAEADDVSWGDRLLNDVMFDRQLTTVGVANVAVECEDSSEDESTISLQDDNDLTTDGGGIMASANMLAIPTFGSISVSDSSEIHFGNKTIYQGPVTIKQLVYANSKEPIVDGSEEGHVPDGNGLTICKGAQQQVERRDALKVCLGWASRHRGCIACLLSSLGILMILTILLALLIRTDPPVDEVSTGELFYKRPIGVYDTTLSGKLRILPRKDWLAQPPSDPYRSLDLPVPYVIISHTATEPCFKQSECVFSVRTAQTFHIESKGWSDIAYNFLVGGDGYVYTGRGWDAVGAHTFGYNTCGIGISLIGTFIKKHPTDIQFLAMKQLIEEGVRLGKIRPDYKLLGHRQLSKTESPGQFLFNDIEVLPHWLSEPVPCNRVNELLEQGDTHQSRPNSSDISSH